MGATQHSNHEEDGIAFSWKVHDNLSDWTARVDVKASIALAIEAAVLGFVVTLTTDGHALSGVCGYVAWILAAGISLLLASVALSIFVVLPQLRARKAKKEAMSNTIYFGHLRHWDADELAERLEKSKSELPQLSRQLVNMSKIVWRKHLWLQWSLFALLGGVALVICTLALEVWF